MRCERCGHEPNTVSSSKVTLYLCPVCNILTDDKGRRIFYRHPEPQSENKDLCDYCWAKMVPDYNRWRLECPEPLCPNPGRRLQGLSPSERENLKAYRELRQKVFDLAAEGQDIPAELSSKLKELSTRVKNTGKYAINERDGF